MIWIMEKVLALVLAGGRVDELLCLTEKRAKAALPVFGIYRIIDFVLSNLMHAGIENVGILSQYRPHDLVRHIGTGEHWDFIGRTRGIRILPPYRGLHSSDWYKGTADAVYQNISYIEEFKPDHILVASADHIYRMDYRPFIDFHIEKKADATICFAKLKTKSSRFGYGVMEKGRLVKYFEKPSSPVSDYVSMTLYIFRREFLMDVLSSNARRRSHEFGRDIIPAIIPHNKIYGYVFKGYWAYARTIDSYYETNMELLKGKIDLNAWQVRTNLLERSTYKDRLPAYINGVVMNSVVSDECIIEGTVKNSILSPGVVVARNAEVVDSIIFHDTKIRSHTKLKKVICDKDSIIEEKVTIGYEGKGIPSRKFKELMHSGITVLGRNIFIPEGARIGANTVIYPGAEIRGSRIKAGSVIQ
ncbi:MAG TPA: glucose-1-phosphate adenylyltransferase [candidate division WOR-3 bacterium]|uniref:Glucose-1-phosphate adenylyltransferase n=1 Tax=candidate division WOR-3 bacterium TaxID=2052148 RepID=A0A9C9EM63_UNCW3|nr:glucose-1-phosphate adenylyltransferase [candidate division WOR-3 bacterium]